MLYLQLMEGMSLVALTAYIFSHSNTFKKLIKNSINLRDKIIMIISFTILSILGTYIGVDIQPHAIANTRPIGAIVAGMMGGPIVGIIVGAIAGFHRYTLGGFTAVACGIATVIEGLTGGLIRLYLKDKNFSIKTAFIGGSIAETFQMLLILLIAKPFYQSLALEKVIALPMILVNSLGVAIFWDIINRIKIENAKTGAIQAQRVLAISKQTLFYMRLGLSKNTADKIVKIIYKIGIVQGVFIADKKTLLSYCGESLSEILLSHNLGSVFSQNSSKIIKFEDKFKDEVFYCVPLVINENKFEGILGLKVKSEKNLDSYFIEFCQELGSLLSMQIELYTLNKLAEGVQAAELKSLRAQIHPHFFFNALNTISCFCRTDPMKAKDLILDLSNYFRKTLKRDDDFVTLNEEIELIKSYLHIEQARFGPRLKVYFNIPMEILNFKIPVFLLQPLVENSIKHGIHGKKDGGSVFINAEDTSDDIIFEVTDTGIGMNPQKYKEVITKWPGIGLKNVNDRLILLYGPQYGVDIKSVYNEGTRIKIIIPKG
ncbi:LytS/YhcK type 5TM receptor domain-containing protein [Clostridium estertheticum]|uniref:LytS/YhcK type 5TM receptor domain-containing protein n=1 Tax=Clostridium estertheticum TaxID=238834 RepID=UPI001CF4279F|nr:LytS/YhcK type 5TM receptor domain-containing protein [Clostridium estertheticum]MCB2343221.1 histidine kinase [Clostridium estertheticum]